MLKESFKRRSSIVSLNTHGLWHRWRLRPPQITSVPKTSSPERKPKRDGRRSKCFSKCLELVLEIRFSSGAEDFQCSGVPGIIS